MNEEIKCCYEAPGCKGVGEFQIGFRAWAVGHTKTSTPLVCHFSMCVCSSCKDKVKREDFLMPEGCALINNALIQNGKMEADLSQAELLFDPIIDGRLPMLIPKR